MNAVQQNEFTESLKKLGRRLPEPKAVLVISAHWETEGTRVTDGAELKQIYDFSGFPASLSRLKYSPPGAPALAERITHLGNSGQIIPDRNRGLDHGAWTVLHHLYSDADIPTIQLSLDTRLTEEGHFSLGRLLLPLRKEGVLILGSGNMVHNLNDIAMDQYVQPYDWAHFCDEALKNSLDCQDDDRLLKYGDLDRSLIRRMAPTTEHFLPLLYITALRAKLEPLTYFHQGFQHGSISMRSFVVGN